MNQDLVKLCSHWALAVLCCIIDTTEGFEFDIRTKTIIFEPYKALSVKCCHIGLDTRFCQFYGWVL